MKIQFRTVVNCILFSSLLLSSCSPGQLLGPTVTPSPTVTNTPTFTPSPTATQTQTPTPTITPTPTQIGGGSGKVIFTYARDEFVNDFPDLKGQQNVFMSNLDGSDLVPITDGLRGYNDIEALSPDGNKVLVSSFRSRIRSDDPNAILYLVNLNSTNNEPIQIVQGFSQHSYRPAAGWTNDSRIVYLGKGENGYGIYKINADGSELTKIDTVIKTPKWILAIDQKRVYWSHLERKNYAVHRGDFSPTWWTNLDGSGQGKLESNGIQIEYVRSQIAFSPDKTKIAWVPTYPEPECDTIEEVFELFDTGKYGETCVFLYVAELSNLDHPTKIPLIYHRNTSNGNYEIVRVDSITWTPKGNEMLLLFGGHIRGGWNPPKMYSVGTSSSEVAFLEGFPSLNDHDFGEQKSGAWMLPVVDGFSPDGRKIIISKITSDETRKTVLIDLETMTLEDNFLNSLKNSDAFRNVYLLP